MVGVNPRRRRNAAKPRAPHDLARPVGCYGATERIHAWARACESAAAADSAPVETRAVMLSIVRTSHSGESEG